jgi:hypothetical protein
MSKRPTQIRSATAVSCSGTSPGVYNLPAQSATDINDNFATDVTIYSQCSNVTGQQFSLQTFGDGIALQLPYKVVLTSLDVQNFDVQVKYADGFYYQPQGSYGGEIRFWCVQALDC